MARLPRNLITGVTAREGIAKLVAAAETKRAAQFAPGSVTPAAEVEESEDEITLTLPFGPSVNHYWRHTGNVVYVSKAGKKYRKLVRSLVEMRFQGPTIDYQVAVLIEAWAPNRRLWDPDNRIKALLDALTQAEVWTDDKLVRDVRIVDRGIEPPGRVVVSIRRFRGYLSGGENDGTQEG